ncbi:MAG: hypothetical protein V1800_00675 [Candidatus Latescibacterota bacterium]
MILYRHPTAEGGQTAFAILSTARIARVQREGEFQVLTGGRGGGGITHRSPCRIRLDPDRGLFLGIQERRSVVGTGLEDNARMS